MRVAIVGAGAAGLRAASQLERAGVEVTLFEARKRLGGRLQTIVRGELSYEAGGEWIDGDQPRLIALARELGIELERAQQEPALARFQGETRRTDDLWPAAVEDEARLFTAAATLCRELDSKNQAALGELDNLPLRSFVKQLTSSPAGEWWVSANLRSDEGEDLDRISLLGWLYGYRHYLNRASLHRGEAEMSSLRPKGGFSGLIASLAARLKTEVRPGHRLIAVQPAGDGVGLWFEEGGEERFDRVILTLPPRQIERIRFLDPLPAEKRIAIESVGFARAIKISFEFARAWWIDEGFCGRIHVDSSLQQLWDGTRGQIPVLSAYICGSMAKEWTALPDPQSAARYELDQLFPGRGNEILSVRVHDWIHDEFAGGAFAYHAVGTAMHNERHLAAPFGAVHFAGEYTATWLGFIEGALESADRSANEVLTS